MLREDVDFIIDYNLGRIKIINGGVLSSGVPINVQFENNALFGQQVRNYMGTRLDYYVNDKLNLGGTIVRMSERPYYQKVNYGDDPDQKYRGGPGCELYFRMARPFPPAGQAA